VAYKKPVPLIPKGSLLEQVQKEKKGNWLAQFHLEKKQLLKQS